MYYPKFIPPKDDDVDYNPEIDAIIEAERERGFSENDNDLKLTIDCDMELPDADDLRDVL